LTKLEQSLATPFEVHVLASGSKGNCTLVRYGKTAILIDVGISARRIKTAMKDLDVPLSYLQGVFITHEHSDHIGGLQQFIKETGVPIYTRAATFKEIQSRLKIHANACIPVTKHVLDVGNLTVETFSTSHDAADPMGVACYGGHQKMALLTDTGIVDDVMLGNMDESTMLVLEANHDPFMLQYGAYTPALKRRVAGPHGHLANEVTAQSLLMMKRPPELQVVLAHRSEQNNSIGKVEETISQILNNAGLRIGSDIHFLHGQPKECVSMYDIERRKPNE